MKEKIVNVDKIIVIASGKGGVGKSTISAAISQNLANKNFSTGILDADITGFSIASIFGISSKDDAFDSTQNFVFKPCKKYNVFVLSLGNFVDSLQYLAFRGPMISHVLKKMFFETQWPQLDYLIVDTPPCISDVHISLLNKVKIHKALMVTSCDKLSTDNTIKLIKLYEKYQINIAGVVNNLLPKSSHNGCTLQDIQGAKRVNQLFGIPVLGSFNLDAQIVSNCNQGLKVSKFFPNIENYLL